MRPGKVLMLVGGIVVGIVALALVGAGGTLLWIHGTQRDADGYYTFDEHPYSSAGYALTSDDVRLTAKPTDWFPSGLATVRIVASGDDLFVGIAPREEVDRYLGGVEHSVITSVEDGPFRVTYRQVEGGPPATPPAEQDFWAESASGPGRQQITWELESGDWVLVVMNADASAVVEARLEVGVRSSLLLPFGVGLLVVGLLVAAGAVVLIVVSTRGRAPASASPPARPDVPS